MRSMRNPTFETISYSLFDFSYLYIFLIFVHLRTTVLRYFILYWELESFWVQNYMVYIKYMCYFDYLLKLYKYNQVDQMLE